MDIKIELPKPHPGQQKVLDSKARFKVLQCGRRWGKTLICQIIAITKMLDNKQVAYVCPDHKRSREFFDAVLKFLPEAIIEKDNKSDLKIKLITGGSITFFTGNSLDQFRGYSFDQVTIDEAAIIPDLETMWKRAIRPTLVDRRGEAIFISTPFGKNFFYYQYLRGVNREDGYESFQFTTYDNPTLPPGEVDEMVKDLTESQFSEEILAIAGESSSNPIGTEHIRMNTIQTLSNEESVVIGIDIASSFDFTVCTSLSSAGNMTNFDRFQLPWTQTMERIAQLPSNITKVIDASGPGGAVVYETLIQWGVQNLIPFKFDSNTKPMIITELIRDIQGGRLKFNETTANELSVLQAIRTPTGYVKYEAQSGMKDDCVMALAMANHYRGEAVASANWQLFFC